MNRLLSFKTISVLLAAAAVSAGCAKEKGTEETPEQEISISFPSSVENPLFVVPGQARTIKFAIENASEVKVGTLPQGWEATVNTQDTTVTVNAGEQASREAVLTLTGVSASGETEKTATTGLYCLNDFTAAEGTFVLNEGNMTSENGSLTYITPEGYVIDDAYRTVNGSELGNVAQDMSILGDKIYVISQNGGTSATGSQFENDGMLVIMNAKTLKKEKAFSNDQLDVLDWPTHIVALDETHVYIRDNKGIYRFNPESGELTFVEGTEGAPKSRFVRMNGKAYTYKTGLLSGIVEISAESESANSIMFPFRVDFDINEVLGIQATEDGKIWVMSFGFGKTAIGKFDLSAKEIQQQEITVKPSVGSSGIAFAAKGDEIFYADGTTIYKTVFGGEEEFMVDLSGIDTDAAQLYNGLGIHPVSGNVMINTIKSFAQYTDNIIWSFDFSTSAETPAAKYEDYTNFPAGFYFPSDNK